MALGAYQLISRVLPGQPFGTGADGALTISSNTTQSLTVESCSGTSGATALTTAGTTLSNGDLILIHQSRGTGAGQWEINRVSSGGGTSSLTLQVALQYTYTDSGNSQAQAIKIPQYTTVTVNNGVTWSAAEWDQNINGFLVFTARISATISGTINADGRGYIGGTEDVFSGNWGGSGEGTVGVPDINNGAANGNGGGGGYYGATDQRGGGGGGSNGTAGTNGGTDGSGTGGTAGTTAGVADLSTMVFGGGGGNRGYEAGVGDGTDGSGIVFMFAKSLSLTGDVSLDASNGAYNGSGAGAGGSCLIACQTATLGTNLITALGGTGGGSDSNQAAGGNGGNGRIALHYASSYTGSTNPSLTATQTSALLETGGAFLFNLL